MSNTYKILAAASLGVSMLGNAATLDFSNEYNDKSIHAQGDAYFIEQVEELTGGSVDIALHTSGSLGFKSADHFYAVADNAVQIADTLAGTIGGIDPIFLLSSLPFVADSVDEAQKLYEIARPQYAKVFEDNDQILLYASPWPASGIWSEEMVNSTDALTNLKIRTYDKNGTIAFKEAGAAPVLLSWADVVPQLSTGGISAVLTSAESGANGSFWEHLNHYTEIRYAVPLNMVHMNRDAFEDLSDEEQAAILEAAKRTDAHNWETVRSRLAENYAELKSHDVNIYTDVDPGMAATLKAAAEPAVQEWLENTGSTGQEILDALKAE
ncbi:TRAP transporter substrate-binding protein [Marinobacterium mangrovicola]|uniref:TRAP-type C4-dicarboxylate transport system substrate-binding protein n=1 Tax=Marinobacterium mangrovicola TaxID=1476959 RepID=A0A4R1H606_9GAMM|nr:TRAP transporter substrate-binding protein [Marinobacterium mangrovicola]TCK16548.1 TRAP-type C4-dicarboxylate transport system substrate-binding protein [Marinobacterium mangrovicola]